MKGNNNKNRRRVVIPLYPDLIDDELIDTVAAEPKVVKYLDIPIQHISDGILKKMNRRGTGAELEALLTKLRQRIPGLVLRTSLITGLPGEGEKEFEELCDFLRRAKLERAGVFAYSPEEEQAAQEDKLDKWINAHFEGEKAKKLIIGTSVFLGIALAILIFMLLPYLVTSVFTKGIESSFVKNVIDGVLRILIFLVYIRLVTLSKDIHRVFEYHGAEHKSIHCYEKGLPLTVENIRPQPREHPRCGTSFLFVVMIVSFLVFSVVSWKRRIVAFFLRLLLLPVVVAFSYEINRWAGGHDNWLSRVLSAPGRALQKLTVFEPDDSMMECAARALTLVIPEEKGADRW